MRTYELEYGNKKITFAIERKKVKNVNLTIKNTGEIIVKANENVPLEFIMNFVEKKSMWIVNQIKYFKEYENDNIIEKEFVSGENVRYLGKQYRLKVIESNEEKIKYFRGYIYLYVRDKNDYKNKELLLNKWLNFRCNEIFNSSYEEMYKMIKKYNVTNAKISIRKMKLRWGSCIISKNTIILNKKLITAPKYCIEYVILHELTHMIYKNHDKDFYNFLYTLMPDWKERKRILDEEIVLEL